MTVNAAERLFFNYRKEAEKLAEPELKTFHITKAAIVPSLIVTTDSLHSNFMKWTEN